MTRKLKTLIESAREISAQEREQLIRAVSGSMGYEAPRSGADPHLLLADFATRQGVTAVRDVAEMAVDFWPEDESADDVNSYVYRQRHEDRTSV